MASDVEDTVSSFQRDICTLGSLLFVGVLFMDTVRISDP